MKMKPLTELLRKSFPGCVGGYYSDNLLAVLCKVPAHTMITMHDVDGRIHIVPEWEIIKVFADSRTERIFMSNRPIDGMSVENWFHSQFST